MKKDETPDAYFTAASEWKAELAELRAILRSTELEETIKWGGPVYTLAGKNVVGLGGFKSYFGLWFFQGALLADEKELLFNAQAGKTKALRQMRFRSKDEIDRKAVRAYVEEAMGLARQGVEIQPDRGKAVTVPAELRAALQRRAEAKSRFEAMTPGKRREYAEYVASATRDDTKQKRIDKILPMIESGIGLNDKYRRG
jgi:uncharacterized protein YdeI (YjbR/CyaY-like superfamily)